MKKLSKVLITITSIFLLAGCNKLPWNRKNSDSSGNVVTKESISDAIRNTNSEKNYTIDVKLNLISEDVQSDPMTHSVEIPLKSTSKISYKQEKTENANKTTTKQESSRYEANVDTIKTYLSESLGTEVSRDDVLEFLNSYKAKKGETYTVNAQTGEVVYEKDYSTAEAYNNISVLDPEVQQYYSFYYSSGEYHYNGYSISEDDDNGFIVGLADVEEAFEHGTLDDNGVLTINMENDDGDPITGTAKFTLANNHLENLDLDIKSGSTQMRIVEQFSKFGTTSFEIPDVQRTCRYDHNINHTPSKYAKTEKGHRLVCADCNRYLTSGVEAHVHSHNSYGICEECGFIMGESKDYIDLGDDVTNELLQMKSSSFTSIPVFHYYSYSYNKSAYEYPDSNTNRVWRYYADKNAIVIHTTSAQFMTEDSCVPLVDVEDVVYLNLTDEQKAIVESDDYSLTNTKAMLEGMTPTKTIYSFMVNAYQHKELADSDCETEVIDKCHTNTYVTCEKCHRVVNVKTDVHHDTSKYQEKNTVINGCVTLRETICTDCGDVVDSSYVENHAHQHDVFASLEELDQYHIKVDEFEPHYEHSVFYFPYCSDCGQVGAYYNGTPYVYEVDLDYEQPINHTSGYSKAYRVTLNKDADNGYVLSSNAYSYESEWCTIPHYFDGDECLLCHGHFYSLPDELDKLMISRNTETGLNWMFFYRYSEDSTYESNTKGWMYDSITDHVAHYNVYAHSPYTLNVYYNNDDIFVNKIEVLNDNAQILYTITY